MGGSLACADMEPTQEQLDRLERFVQAVERSPHNLVSKRARGELRERHLAECAAFAATLPTGPAEVLDVGSGGGFPGIVVAVLRPDLRVTLLDSTRKKVEFLNEMCETLGLAGYAVHGRAEELYRGELGSSFDLVTARAVAPLERLVGWTVPFLRPGGLLYAIKGERWEAELDEAADALRDWGAETVATPTDLDGEREPGARAVGTRPDGVDPLVVIIRRTPNQRVSNREVHR